MAIPYFARLWWDESRHRGQAICGDVEVELHQMPPILNAVEIDYGEIHPDEMAYPPEIRERAGDPRRSLEAPEVEAVRSWLRKMAAVVRWHVRGV